MTTNYAAPSAQQLYQTASTSPRDPRSTEYKAGVLADLEFRIDGTPIKRNYHPATAAEEAFSAGIQEGHSIWRRAAFDEGATA